VGFVLRVLVNAAALWVAAALVPGIALRGLRYTLLAALVLGLVNAIVRPVLVFLTLPITLLTLGLFIFVLNAFCLWLTSRLVPGFAVHGFVASVLGALVISIVSWALNAFVSDAGRWRRERAEDVAADASPVAPATTTPSRSLRSRRARRGSDARTRTSCGRAGLRESTC